VEIVTLLVPGFNDSEEELKRLTSFVAEVSPDIPWHVTAFRAQYKMTEPDDTSVEDLLRAAETGRQAGLRFVYAGNLPGMVGGLEDTRCPSCGLLLVERLGYFVRSYHITSEGTCSSCGTAIPGRWGERFTGQITAHPISPHRPRSPR